MSDGYDLERFVEAQDSRGTYQRALAELRSGRKTGHWIWYVLPQVAGLGSSSMSQRYAIGSLAEARAYLAHAVLGPRLHECAEAILAHASQRSAEHILGGIDAMKLRSCATLFRRAAPDEPVFTRVLDAFYGGAPDPATDARL